MLKNKLSTLSSLRVPIRCWMPVISLIFLGMQAYAQETKTVSGTVTHASDNTPIPGANVFVKGTTHGTFTDFDGRYAIAVSPNQTLVFSYVGFSTQEISVGNNDQINVGLEEDAQALDEVVLVGYGSQRKSDLTGSVAVVDAEEAKKLITHDVAKMLQGQAPGVTVQSSGEPGGFVNIKIRGITSFNNNNPLFVIDGVLVDSPYDFATGEIESIQVLKDASAAAIYGQRGANGVVIITTQQGKSGQMKISYRGLTGFQQVGKTIPLTNRIGYQTITNAAELNAGLPIVPGNDPNSPFYIDDLDTDWQREAYGTGIIENHSFGASGGTDVMNFNFNIDYYNNTAYINAPQDYNRYAASLNLNGEKGSFRYGAKLSYTKSNKTNFTEYLAGQSAVV